jgi:hypothetical protein
VCCSHPSNFSSRVLSRENFRLTLCNPYVSFVAPTDPTFFLADASRSQVLDALLICCSLEFSYFAFVFVHFTVI